MPTKRILAILPLLLLSISISKTVHAEFKIPEWIIKSDTPKVSEETKVDACKRIATNVRDKTTVFSANRDIHAKNYARVEQRLKEIASKLSALNMDTSKLLDDVNKYNILVKEYKALYDQLIGLLQVSTEGVCTADGQGLRVELQYAKDQLIGLVRKRYEIRQFYRNTLREDIIALRKKANDNYREGVPNE